MAAAPKNSIINIALTVNIKRSKEEIDYADKETNKLHNLIANDKEIDWAKGRIEKIQDMIFSPAEQVKSELVEKLREVDQNIQTEPV